MISSTKQWKRKTGLERDLNKPSKVSKDVKEKGDAGTQGFDFNFEEEESNDIDLEETASNNIDDLDIQVGDVREQKSEDIFKVLTIRYFKSAYPVLLEQQKQ